MFPDARLANSESGTCATAEVVMTTRRGNGVRSAASSMFIVPWIVGVIIAASYSSGSSVPWVDEIGLATWIAKVVSLRASLYASC